MIPFVDLQAQHRALRKDLESAVLDVLDSATYVLGRSVTQFEESFAGYCGCRYAVALNSGTSALHLALLAAGVGPGDEVITVPMTFVATVSAILYTGARPVFVDIDPVTWTMDPARLEHAIGERTKVIIPVHLHGLVAEMEPIMRIAEPHAITVIEDAAQAHGAVYRGRRAGSLGHIGCFSFYPSKNLGACGEGGAIVTDDAAVAETVCRLRDWGQDGKYNHVLKGYNYRMDGIQGAVLGVKLRHLNRWTALRQSHARCYDRKLAGVVSQLPWTSQERQHVYHVYAPLLAHRSAVQERLGSAGIATSIHYPRPIHMQPAFADLGYGPGDFSVAEWFAHHTLSLPMFPELTEAQIDRVCDVLSGVVHAEAI
jgi:dTDP-4-amino-4,6-dideoxygalactose transaminase